MSGVTSPTETDAAALSPFAAAAGSAFARSSMSGSCFTSPRPDNGYNRVRWLISIYLTPPPNPAYPSCPCQLSRPGAAEQIICCGTAWVVMALAAR